jgi:hypothetical protein
VAIGIAALLARQAVVLALEYSASDFGEQRHHPVRTVGPMTDEDLDELVIEDDFALDPELSTTPDEAFARSQPASPDGEPERRDIPFEANEADAYEQSRAVASLHRSEQPSLPAEVNEADAYEQTIEVGEEDDYR